MKTWKGWGLRYTSSLCCFLWVSAIDACHFRNTFLFFPFLRLNKTHWPSPPLVLKQGILGHWPTQEVTLGNKQGATGLRYLSGRVAQASKLQNGIDSNYPPLPISNPRIRLLYTYIYVHLLFPDASPPNKGYYKLISLIKRTYK